MRGRIWGSLFVAASAAVCCACGGDDPCTTCPAPRTEIRGFVEDAYGQPVAGVAVVVGGRASVTSGSDGSFRVSAVGSPYDVTIVSVSEGRAVAYLGLTRSDPRLYFPTAEPEEKGVVVTGTVPAAPGRITRIFFAGEGFTESVDANSTSGAYHLTVRWRLPTFTLSGRLFALRWIAGADGKPSQYDGWASRDLVVTSPGVLGDQDFTSMDFLDPPEQHVAGEITGPSGYTLSCCGLALAIGPHWLPLEVPSRALTFDFTVPGLPGASFLVEGMAREAVGDQFRISYLDKRGIQAPASGLALDVRRAASLSLPVHLARNVTTASLFQWSVEGEEGISIVAFVPLVAGDPEYTVYLDGASTRIPDVWQAGLGLPFGREYAWAVARLFPVASIDEIASKGSNTAAQTEIGVSYSEARAFFTGTSSSTSTLSAGGFDELGAEELARAAITGGRAPDAFWRSRASLVDLVPLQRSALAIGTRFAAGSAAGHR